MSTIKVLGIDLGKSVFILLVEVISQLPCCHIAFEACCGAHWLARQCQQHGHQVCLIPLQYVKKPMSKSAPQRCPALALFCWSSVCPCPKGMPR